MRPLLTQFKKHLRALLHACSAGRTFLLVHDRQSRFRVHMQRIEIADGHAVALAEAAERTSRFTGIERRLHGTRRRTVIDTVPRPVGLRTVAAQYGHHRFPFRRRLPEEIGDTLHGLRTAHRAEQSGHIVHTDRSRGESTATGITAAAAVGPRQHLFDIVDTRVLIHLELLRHEIQYQCAEYTQHA